MTAVQSPSSSSIRSARSERTFEFDLAVIGLGYVGLPVVVAAFEAGLSVLGFDIDVSKVEGLRGGRSHIEDIAHGRIPGGDSARFTVTSDSSFLSRCAAIVIAVPTPLTDSQPDLTAVLASGRAVAQQLVPGQLVVLESTTYPGTTEEALKPVLEELSGLVAGRDFGLAYSPERIDPGNEQWTLENTPKLVSGIDEESLALASELYGAFCADVIKVRGTREAEMAKLLENTYRHVNIALVNEMAVFCHQLGIDIWEVINAASSKPFGFQAFYPGPGVGGHCIPIDPNYLSYRVRQLGYPFRFVELAGEINSRMPVYIVDRIGLLLNDHKKSVNGSRVLVVGVAYKPNVADTRESPAVAVIRTLRARGAVVSFADPHVAEFSVDGAPVDRIDDPVAAAGSHDATVLLAAHEALDLDAIAVASQTFLDTRGAVAGEAVVRL